MSDLPFIVKVQLPLAGAPAALVYTKDRKQVWQLPVFPEVRTAMRGSKRAFFLARIVDQHIELQERLPEQGW